MAEKDLVAKEQLKSSDFILTWQEYEKAFYCVKGCVEAVDIYHNKQVGNC